MTLIILTIISISILLAPMGCIMLWNRYNYFHDGLVHACLFSGVISYFLNTSHIISMMIVAVSLAILVFILKFYSNKNAVVSLVSSAFLATSIIAASKLNERTLFESMLFGDIFAINEQSFYLVLVMLCAIFLLLWKYLDQIVIISIDPDIAKTSKQPIHIIEFTILLILALIIAISIKLIGAFLIGTLLIIPAIGARLIAKSPVQMLVGSVCIGLVSGISGFYLSLTYDWPLSPSISVISIFAYIFLSLIKSFRS